MALESQEGKHYESKTRYYLDIYKCLRGCIPEHESSRVQSGKSQHDKRTDKQMLRR